MNKKVILIILLIVALIGILLYWKHTKSIENQVNYNKVVAMVLDSEIEGQVMSLFKVANLDTSNSEEKVLTSYTIDDKQDYDKFKAGIELFKSISEMQWSKSTIDYYKPGNYYKLWTNIQFAGKKFFRDFTYVYQLELYINKDDYSVYMKEKYYDRSKGISNINNSEYVKYKSDKKMIELIERLFKDIKE